MSIYFWKPLSFFCNRHLRRIYTLAHLGYISWYLPRLKWQFILSEPASLHTSIDLCCICHTHEPGVCVCWEGAAEWHGEKERWRWRQHPKLCHFFPFTIFLCHPSAERVCFLQHPPLAQRAAAAEEELLFCSFSYFPSTWKVLKLTNVMTYFLWLNGKGHKADFFPTRKITAAAPFLWTRSFLYFSLLSLPAFYMYPRGLFFTLSPFAGVLWSFKLIFLVSSCQRGHTNTYLLLNARSIISAGKIFGALRYILTCMEGARACT